MLDGGKRKKEQNFEKEEVEEEEKNSREMLATFFLLLKIKERKINFPIQVPLQEIRGKEKVKLMLRIRDAKTRDMLKRTILIFAI